MKLLLKLYSTQDKAADGSVIPRSSTETYLASEDYKTIIRDRIAIGGLSHKDRRLSSEYSGIIGNDDQVLVNDNATHYFTKIFLKGPEDPFVYGEIEFFDPELFTGKRRENIINLIGLLKSGVKLPVSIVIHALWNMKNEAEKIIRIKGVDFTANNSFPNAGPVDLKGIKTMSDTSVEIIKQFSLTDEEEKTHSGCKSIEKVFSGEVRIIDDAERQFDFSGFGNDEFDNNQNQKSDESVVSKIKEELKTQLLNDIKNELENELTKDLEKLNDKDSDKKDSPTDLEPNEHKRELEIPEDKLENKKNTDFNKSDKDEKRFSRNDIIRVFGRNSYEAKSIKNKNFSYITESELAKLSDELRSSDPDKIRVVSKPIGLDITLDDNELLEELIKDAINNDDKVVLENIVHSNRNLLSQILSSVPKDEPNRKELLKIELNQFFRNVPELAIFSTINTVKDRMFITKYPRLILMNRIMRGYKQYWKQFGDKLNDYESSVFNNLVIQDINLLLRNIADKILKGQTINSIYGLAQFGNEKISQSAIALSRSYRQILLIEKVMGFIPEKKYQLWKSELKKFYESILSYIRDEEVIYELALVDKLRVS